MNIPAHAITVLKALESAGFSAYLVGGAVRDLLSGTSPHDIDITTSATPADVMTLFERTIPTGIKHGTVTVIIGGTPAEVTTFRHDGGYADHRRPDSVEWSTDLLADLSRRDFTIGAIALDAHGNIIDPFDGRRDIENRVLRCVGDPDTRFREDALRMIRAVRFMSYGYNIEPNTLAALQRNAPLTRYLSPERIASELHRILDGANPDTAYALVTYNLLDYETKQDTEPPKLSALPIEYRTAVFASCAGGEAFARALKLNRKTIAYCRAIDNAPTPHTLPDRKRLFCRLGDDQTLAIAAAQGWYSDAQQIIASGEPRNLSMLAVSGRDLINLGYNDKAVGEALQRLFDIVADNAEYNTRDILLSILGS